MEGTSYFFYENGNLKKEITYSGGVVNGWVKLFYEDGLPKEEFYVDYGIRDGVDKIYYENGALKEVRYYKKGKLVKTIKLDYDPTYVAPPSQYVGNNQQKIISSTNEIICDTDECPAPIGGIPAIQRKAKYPEHAKLYGLEGDVILIATIDTSGNVIDTKILKGLGLGLDEAAQKAVKETKFFPGKNKGKPVVSHATIKVNFSLGKKKHQVVARTETKHEFKQFVEEELYGDNASETPEPEKETRATKNKKEATSQAIKEKAKHETNIPRKVVINCPAQPCAQPVGGAEAIMKNFKIPKRVKEENINGVVKIEALIDKYGKVRETKILQGLPEGANDAAEVAVYYTDFKPAVKNGERVNSKLIITIPVFY